MKTLYALLITVFLLSCNHKGNDEISSDVVVNPNTASGSKADNLPVFNFKEETHDFGRVTQGERLAYYFKFTNTGKSDLLISSANVTCGCTVPKFPKEPIKPGAEGVIEIVFNTEGKSGFQDKSIKLIANTQPNTKVLHIKADIYLPEQNK